MIREDLKLKVQKQELYEQPAANLKIARLVAAAVLS